MANRETEPDCVWGPLRIPPAPGTLRTETAATGSVAAGAVGQGFKVPTRLLGAAGEVGEGMTFQPMLRTPNHAALPQG